MGTRIVFIDTSVFVAIFAHEEDAQDWMSIIVSSPGKTTSALVILETVMRLTTKLNLEPAIVLAKLEAFIVDARIAIMPIDENHGWLAVEAFAKFGKGRGHPAQLNLADCLSYACAMSGGMPLLFKGNDFSCTDIPVA